MPPVWLHWLHARLRQICDICYKLRQYCDIYVSRRRYRNVNDTKSGKRREMTALASFNTACELGFRGSLNEWNRLMGAVARR